MASLGDYGEDSWRDDGSSTGRRTASPCESTNAKAESDLVEFETLIEGSSAELQQLAGDPSLSIRQFGAALLQGMPAGSGGEPANLLQCQQASLQRRASLLAEQYDRGGAGFRTTAASAIMMGPSEDPRSYTRTQQQQQLLPQLQPLPPPHPAPPLPLPRANSVSSADGAACVIAKGANGGSVLRGAHGDIQLALTPCHDDAARLGLAHADRLRMLAAVTQALLAMQGAGDALPPELARSVSVVAAHLETAVLRTSRDAHAYAVQADPTRLRPWIMQVQALMQGQQLPVAPQAGAHAAPPVPPPPLLPPALRFQQQQQQNAAAALQQAQQYVASPRKQKRAQDSPRKAQQQAPPQRQRQNSGSLAPKEAKGQEARHGDAGAALAEGGRSTGAGGVRKPRRSRPEASASHTGVKRSHSESPPMRTARERAASDSSSGAAGAAAAGQLLLHHLEQQQQQQRRRQQASMSAAAAAAAAAASGAPANALSTTGSLSRVASAMQEQAAAAADTTAGARSSAHARTTPHRTSSSRIVAASNGGGGGSSRSSSAAGTAAATSPAPASTALPCSCCCDSPDADGGDSGDADDDVSRFALSLQPAIGGGFLVAVRCARTVHVCHRTLRDVRAVAAALAAPLPPAAALIVGGDGDGGSSGDGDDGGGDADVDSDACAELERFLRRLLRRPGVASRAEVRAFLDLQWLDGTRAAPVRSTDAVLLQLGIDPAAAAAVLAQSLARVGAGGPGGGGGGGEGGVPLD
ncbi:hypothetical protein JKP88DRAFT_296562 [Tribonema minus]|uniref:Uncharacterized protein n=1 Tax=Tribonema minus TaxID=303371 RepID=A0A835ZDS7_9STRA|nr:hypothetical protein JKP88DRAFT_296562 [Tribonema minus]